MTKKHEKVDNVFNNFTKAIILFNNILPTSEYYELNRCSVLTSCKEEDIHYKYLNEFYERYLGYTYLLSLFECGNADFCFELKNICLTPDSKSIGIGNKLIEMDFYITEDIFMKMVLIYLRIRANVPVLLIGESACGKKSLIKALYYFIEDRYKLIIFKLNSQMNYSEILNFFDKYELFENISSNKQIDKKKILLVLEEIN